MAALIGVLPGDGIGPEVIDQALRVLDAIARRSGRHFELRQGLIGGAAIDATGKAFPEDTRRLALEADAVLLGAVGGPKWSDPAARERPEQGLLDLRAAMGVYANVRPVRTHPSLYDASPLRPERIRDVDILVIRELTGGIYFGAKQRDADRASDLCSYSRAEIERVLRVAGVMARGRRGRVTSVDKANVLETSRLWRSVANELFAREFPELQLEHMLVDAAAMHLLSRPREFDVLVTENMFGDILTDEASMLAGSMGMLPSASLDEKGRGLYEPIHGSAPDIAGRGIANPCGTILSAAMLLRHSLGLEAEAARIENAVHEVLESGLRTRDIAAASSREATTVQMGDAVVARLNA
ncbi:MAG: 3-isopropylmalate dehydrogenase [Gammaproteobacteria bacterium]|nr:MAG: 3-isopropylmalate dehydrogenase [Pseudomonadota bacterium]MBC6943987.1 3-isopropylmalate dehydrogenase [Gammaproteobacteria bacterium]MCE7895209.1 3-isopropylmalate dehydrogenase [Gammaproteobacteria bacterium PRO8]MDL1880305.1 3-isopropylmalate dehydrogenase [Gammaproteobacteria bacterium PRO2]MCL4776073.1 3-isopropylmalate dehydrogenase [Gammaproteobacteria bacterium]